MGADEEQQVELVPVLDPFTKPTPPKQPLTTVKLEPVAPPTPPKKPVTTVNLEPVTPPTPPSVPEPQLPPEPKNSSKIEKPSEDNQITRPTITFVPVAPKSSTPKVVIKTTVAKPNTTPGSKPSSNLTENQPNSGSGKNDGKNLVLEVIPPEPLDLADKIEYNR